MSTSSTTFATRNIALPVERTDDEVLDQRVLEHRLAPDEVDDRRRPLVRRAEPQRAALARLQPDAHGRARRSRTLIALGPASITSRVQSQ